MATSYLVWAFVALVSYTMVSPLVSYVSADVPVDVVTLVTNGMLAVAVFGLVLYQGQEVAPYLTHPKAPYMYLAGVLLTVGIIAYYRALSLGPVSVVVPIFGMFLVGSSVVGILFLSESLTPRKAAGIGFAALAVYLTTVE
ncbi:MAG TPA: EamA family transporter [Halobacteriales archaeon]|nr:EamA family transporter [Halobacteriales archaeon]